MIASIMYKNTNNKNKIVKSKALLIKKKGDNCGRK